MNERKKKLLQYIDRDVNDTIARLEADVTFHKSQAEKWERKYHAALKARDAMQELNGKLFDEIQRLKQPKDTP